MQDGKHDIDRRQFADRCVLGNSQKAATPTRQQASDRLHRIQRLRENAIPQFLQQPCALTVDQDGYGIVFFRVKRLEDITRRQNGHIMFGGTAAKKNCNP